MEKIELLQSVSIFWDLNENDLGHIADKMVAKHFENGNYIFLEDSEGEQCFFVLEGSVKVTRLSKDGREVILAMLNEGDFFGEMSLLDGESRSANVIALEKTKVLPAAAKSTDAASKSPNGFAVAVADSVYVSASNFDLGGTSDTPPCGTTKADSPSFQKLLVDMEPFDGKNFLQLLFAYV